MRTKPAPPVAKPPATKPRAKAEPRKSRKNETAAATGPCPAARPSTTGRQAEACASEEAGAQARR